MYWVYWGVYEVMRFGEGVQIMDEKDSRESKSIEIKSQHEDINSCVYAIAEVYDAIKVWDFT